MTKSFNLEQHIWNFAQLSCHLQNFIEITSLQLEWERNEIWITMEKSFVIRALGDSLRPRQNGRHFADDILKRIFFNENVWISIKISLKFVSKGPINKILALVQTMAWRRPGDKPLSEPMLISLQTHICVTRPQWVNNWLLPFKQGTLPPSPSLQVLVNAND